MKNRTQTIVFWGVCVFLTAYFMRFANFPNEVAMILGGFLCLLLVVQRKQLRIDAGICFLTVALVSYYVILNGKSGFFYSILYIPLILYELGNYMASMEAEHTKKENVYFVLLFVLIVGYSIHGILNASMYYAGYVVPGTRRWQDFWSGEIVPGTQHAAYFFPVMALFLPTIFTIRKNIWLSSGTILLTLFFGYTSLATKSRMSVLIFAIIVCIQMILYAILEWNRVKTQLKSKKLWCAAAVILVGVLIGAAAVWNSEIVTAFVNNMGKGGGIINNIRFQTQRKALTQLFLYPMGGNQMDLGGISHAHNVWLDMANAAGLLPFFAFTAYTVYTLYELIKLLRKKELPTEQKLVFLGLYGSFFLYYTVEPALEANIHLLTPWIYVNGLIHGSLNVRKTDS